MKRWLACLLVAGCGALDAGINPDGGSGGSGGGSGGSGGGGGGLVDAASSDGPGYDGGGTGGTGGSGGSGGAGDAGPPCSVALQSPAGPFFAGDPVSLMVAFGGPGNATAYQWTTSQGSISDTGPVVTLDTTTEGTYLVMVTVFTDLNGSCSDVKQLDVQPRDPRYVRLRVTPPIAGPPRQARAILPQSGAQSVLYDFTLDPGTLTSLSITAGGSSVAGYMRLADRSTCLPVEAYPSATAAVQIYLLPVPFDVLVIPQSSQLAPFLYADHTGPLALGVLAGTAVSGRVLAAGGSPIAGAHIELTSGTLPSSIADARASDGAFEAHTMITAAALDAIIAPPDSSLPIAQTTGAPIPALGITPPSLVFTYDPVTPAHVSGTVTLPGGAAAIGAHLTFVAHQPFARVGQLAVGGGTPMDVGGTARAETVTGPSGGFGPIALPPAVYDVLVEPPNGPPVARLRTTIDLTAGDRTQPYALGALVTLSGTITDANQQPLPAFVRAIERGASAIFTNAQSASSFNILVDPGATYDVYATPAASTGLARATGTITVPQGGAQIALVAHPGVTFHGRISDANGGVGGALVEALLGADCSVSTTVVADTISGRDGSYTIVVPVPASP